MLSVGEGRGTKLRESKYRRAFFPLFHSLAPPLIRQREDWRRGRNRYKWPRVGLGRFPFDQKFRKFRVGERMEQTFSGISFRNFGCISRGWPNIPENRNIVQQQMS